MATLTAPETSSAPVPHSAPAIPARGATPARGTIRAVRAPAAWRVVRDEAEAGAPITPAVRRRLLRQWVTLVRGGHFSRLTVCLRSALGVFGAHEFAARLAPALAAELRAGWRTGLAPAAAETGARRLRGVLVQALRRQPEGRGPAIAVASLRDAADPVLAAAAAVVLAAAGVRPVLMDAAGPSIVAVAARAAGASGLLLALGNVQCVDVRVQISLVRRLLPAGSDLLVAGDVVGARAMRRDDVLPVCDLDQLGGWARTAAGASSPAA